MLKFWKQQLDVPFHKDTAYHFVPWIMGLMIFLATISLVIATVISSYVKGWEKTTTSGFTVELLPEMANSSESTLNQQQAALKLLQNTYGVAKAQIISRHEFTVRYDLLNQFQPMAPTLINVDLRSDHQVDLYKIKKLLHQNIPGAVIRDHQQWRQKAFQYAQSIIWISIIVASLIGLSAILTIAFVVHTGLAIQEKTLKILSLIGAKNIYIAQQFQSHALNLATKGGIIGIIFSLLTIYGIGTIIDNNRIIAINNVIMIIGVTPLIAIILTAVAARLTVLATLAKEER